MPIFQTGWYIIYTKPRHEKKIQSNLTDRKIDAYVPTKKTLRIWQDRKKYVEEPIFPCYVFVFLKDMQHYYTGMHTDGALYYLRTGKELARIGETVINNIKLATGYSTNIEVTSDKFLPGRKLEICQGVLTGLSCEVVEWKNNKKILVRVELLQRSILLKFPEEHLIRV